MMINKNSYLLIFFIIFFSPAFLFNTIAQSTDFSKDYQPLKSVGTLPKVVTTPSSRKYKKQLSRINKSEKRSEKKAKKKFFLESNFLIDDMLRSGYVLYNDPLGQYVNKVADIVLEKQPDLRKKLQFYVLRSATVNAFTTDQGIIFISMGLLSQLENEAQLAFILCHEIVHYQEEHGLDLFLKVDQINNKTSQKYVLKKSIVDKDFFKFSFSKELETEADDKGFDLYLDTNYDVTTVDGVFNVLAYSYLPFDDRPFNKQFFEQAHYTFPEDYQIEKVSPIAPLQAEDDTESTHPSISKRKAAIQQKNTQTNEGRLTHILPEEQFKKVQQIARFEVPLLSLDEEEYYRSIFESYLLLLEFPENLYLKKCIAKSLYLAAKYKNEGYSYDKQVTDFEGELQGLVHFVKKMSDKELSVLAATYVWQLQEDYPEDKELAFIASDALTELSFWHQLKVDDFKIFSAATSNKATSKISPTDKKELSKMDKVRAITKADNATYWQFAFTPYLAQDKFLAAWKTAEKTATNRQERIDFYESDKGREETKKQFTHKNKKGARLGIPKIVVVNPFYLNIDGRKEQVISYEKGEKAQATFHQLLKDNAKICGLNMKILDADKLRSNDIEKFNDLSILNEWFTNQINFRDLSITPGIRQNEIARIVEKYDTKYFCWTGVIAIRDRKPIWPYFGAFTPIAWPFMVAHAFKNSEQCLYYNVLYNVETGSYDVVKFQYLTKVEPSIALNLHVYDSFLQIKSK